MAVIILIALLLAGWVPADQAELQAVIVGGDSGLEWGDAGDIPPTVIRGRTTVAQTNTPGGVIDFDSPGRINWIFPEEVDTARNIMLGLTSPERGGSVFTPTISLRSLESQFVLMIDDGAATALEVRPERAGESTRATGFIMQFDLGAVFAVNRIRFFPRNADPAYEAPAFPNQKDFLKSFEIFANDGAPESENNGVPIFQTLEIVAKNQEPVVDLKFEPQFIRQLRLKVLTSTEFEIAEFQAFAQGFVPRATYVSNLFDFGASALLGNIRWVQEQQGDPFMSRMRIRTRTGVDSGTVVFPRVGLQPSGRINFQGDDAGESIEVDIPIEALWKRADEFDGSTSLEAPAVFKGDTLHTLQEIVTVVLDNPDLDGRDVLLFFNELPPERRAALEIDESYYKREVDESERSGVREDLRNWSPWSPPHSPAGIVEAAMLPEAGAGTPIASPNPRRYFQFMVEFANENFDAATGLGGLAFDVQTPAFTDSLIAEIIPRTTTVGKRTRFTYAILNKAGTNTSGFDQIEIDTPIRTEAVAAVEIDRAGSLQAADFTGVSLDDLPVTRNEIAIEEVRDDGFIISFPRIESAALVKVEFDNAVLRFGTSFASRARNSGNDVMGQEVFPGNAADLSGPGREDPDSLPVGSLSSKNLSVSVPITRDILINVRADPPVFTPNGDGVNDGARILYDITNIAEPRPVELEIFDLSGRRVRRLYDGLGQSGRFGRLWDGRDDANELVPPGNYIFTLSLAATTGTAGQIGIVAVAY